MDKTRKRTFSEEIQHFLDHLSQIRSNAQLWQEELSRTEQLTMDYLHQLELEEAGYHDRAKIASNLVRARQESKH